MTCEEIASAHDLNACATTTTDFAFLVMIFAVMLLYLAVLVVLLLQTSRSFGTE